ncbi:EpsG family protein [Phocaeicola barnesiae]|uniref:EpsG family protein n=1 Tax=Phocaeicola barnesiae TaxID=376804 RepID=UPI0025A38458|nr:EpsG family protein [Phocaeicola barnesiae]MDM8234660.1 EpsG family protein [Phocaeicola barnesiae]
MMFGIYLHYYKYPKTKYIPFIISSALIYSLVEGLRYARGTDYLWYRQRYDYPLIDEQVLFKSLNDILKTLGFNFTGACIIYSLLFIICAYIFIYNIGKTKLKTAYLFLICATILRSECYIRQFIGISFILLSIAFFFKKKWIGVVLALAAASQTHTATLILFICFIFFYFFKKYIIPSKIAIIILFFVYFLSMLDYTQFLIMLIEKFLPASVIPANFEGYINNADRWLGEDSFLEGSEQSTSAKMLQFIFEVSIILLSDKLLKIKSNEKIQIFYNMFIVGAILTRAFWGMEIIIRITFMLYMFWFIPAAYIFDYKKSKLFKPFKYQLLFYLIILYLVLYWGRYIFLNPNSLFVWS